MCGCVFMCGGATMPCRDTVMQISESKVTGNRDLARYREVIPAQTLSGEELKRLNSLSVVDAMRYLSGVQLKDYGGVGGLKTVNVRSLGTNHTAVSYDGIQLGNAQNGQVDLGRFSLDDVAEITLYNGQKSDIFQPAKDFGASGSIYINTAKPQFDDGKRLNLKASLKGGSFGLVNPSARLEYKISDAVAASFSAGLTNASGRYKFRYRDYDSRGHLAYDTTAVRHNGDIFSLRTEAALYGTLDHGSWNVRAYNYNSDRGIPGAIVSNVFSNGERMRDDNMFVQGRFVTNWTNRLRSMLNAKYAYDYTFYQDKDIRSLYTENRYRQQEVYVSVANLCNVTDFWDISLSFDFQWNYLDADNYMSGNLPFPQPVRFTEMLSLASALDLGRLKMQASVLGSFVRDKARVTDGGDVRSRKEMSPALFLSYRLLPRGDFLFRAFSKRSFRMPTFNDLYYTNSARASLKPEYTFQTDAGLSYSGKFSSRCVSGKVDVSADGYWNTVKDKIIAYPGGQQFRWTMLNLGKVDIGGVDVSSALTLVLGKIEFGARLQYTWQKAVDVTDRNSSYYRNQIPYVPRHSGSAVLSLGYGGWGLNYSFIYTGERYSQKENTLRSYVEPWYTSDIALQKTFTFGGRMLRAMLEVNNLFGQDYEVVLNYPMPKTNFRMSLWMEL